MRLAPVIAGGLLMLTLGTAQAATMVVTGTLASTAVPTGGLDTTISVDKFNIADATLTAIDLTFVGGVSGTVTLQRRNEGPTTVTYAVELGADFALTAGTDLLVDLDDVVAAGSITITRSGSRTGSTSLATSSSAIASVAPALFAQFTGTGSVALGLEILRDNFVQTVSGARLSSQTFNNFAWAEVEVTYTYSSNAAVPEPMGLALFGLGLAGLGLARRRNAA